MIFSRFLQRVFCCSLLALFFSCNLEVLRYRDMQVMETRDVSGTAFENCPSLHIGVNREGKAYITATETGAMFSRLYLYNSENLENWNGEIVAAAGPAMISHNRLFLDEENRLRVMYNNNGSFLNLAPEGGTAWPVPGMSFNNNFYTGMIADGRPYIAGVNGASAVISYLDTSGNWSPSITLSLTGVSQGKDFFFDKGDDGRFYMGLRNGAFLYLNIRTLDAPGTDKNIFNSAFSSFFAVKKWSRALSVVHQYNNATSANLMYLEYDESSQKVSKTIILDSNSLSYSYQTSPIVADENACYFAYYEFYASAFDNWKLKYAIIGKDGVIKKETIDQGKAMMSLYPNKRPEIATDGKGNIYIVYEAVYNSGGQVKIRMAENAPAK